MVLFQWCMIVLLAVLIRQLYVKVVRLEKRIKRQTDVVVTDHIRFESADVAALLIDRHVQSHHKGQR